MHRRIRAAREKGGDESIIPWLTTGTYGYVPPRSARATVWEAFLNGAAGITYFCFSDLNPGHVLEVSRALAAVAPLEDVIVDGEPAHDQVRITPASIRHSAIRLGERAGLLLANPGKEPCTAEWSWPGTSAGGRTPVPPNDAVLLDVRLQ